MAAALMLATEKTVAKAESGRCLAAPSLFPRNDCVQSRLLKDTLLTSGDGRPPVEPFVKKDGLKTNAFITRQAGLSAPPSLSINHEK